MKALVTETERAFLALGNVQYGVQKAEEKSKAFKRSIYISKDLKAGDMLSMENVKIIRPGFGLESRYIDMILGRKLQKDAAAGTPLTWDIIWQNGSNESKIYRHYYCTWRKQTNST